MNYQAHPHFQQVEAFQYKQEDKNTLLNIVYLTGRAGVGIKAEVDQDLEVFTSKEGTNSPKFTKVNDRDWVVAHHNIPSGPDNKEVSILKVMTDSAFRFQFKETI